MSWLRPGNQGAHPASARGGPPAARTAGLFAGSVLLPAAAATWFVARYGVNIPVHDEWNFVPTVNAFFSGGPWMRLSLQHYGEHRIIVSKLFILGLAAITNWNTKIAMFVAVGLLALAATLFFVLLYRTHVFDWWVPLSIGWLTLGVTQYENLLVGWQVQVPLMLAAAVGTVLVMDTPVMTPGRLTLGSCLAVVTSFSFGNGLVIWPAIVPLLVIRRQRKGTYLALWGLGAVMTTVFYWAGYHDFGRAPRGYLGTVITAPIRCLTLGLDLLGLGIGGGTVTRSIVAGFVISGGLAACSVWLLRRRDSLERFAPWVAVVTFGLGSISAVALGRAFEWRHFALASRFVTLGTPALAGTLVFVSAVLKRDVEGVMVLTVRRVGAIVLGIWGVLGYVGMVRVAVGVGAAVKKEKLAAWSCVIGFREADETCLRKLYNPVSWMMGGEVVRERAVVLERWGLGPFEGRRREAADDFLVEGSIERVTGEEGGSSAVVNDERDVEVTGWAFVDWGIRAAEVVVVADDQVIAETATFTRRPDVSLAFGLPVEASGWRAKFNARVLGVGVHRLQVKVRRNSGGPARALRQEVVLTVTGEGDGKRYWAPAR